jgi:hypothetical protein
MISLRMARLMVYPARTLLNVLQDNRRLGHTRAQTGAINDGLHFFGLQPNIQFEIVNISVKILSHFRDLRVRIPFQETGIS